MIIAVSGTPGTGKTTLAKALAKKLGYMYGDVKQLIEEQELYEDYDKRNACYIVDEDRLCRTIAGELLKDGIKDAIIDSHLSHLLPRDLVGRCIITTCELKTLEKRLNKRGYPKQKIRENLDAEIFETCFTEAAELGHKPIKIDTTNDADIDSIIRKLRISKRSDK